MVLLGVEPNENTVSELGQLGVTEMVLGLPDGGEGDAIASLDEQARLVERWSEENEAEGARL